MSPFVILYTGPISNSVVGFPTSGTTAIVSRQCRQWIRDCEQSGVALLIPAICYYETLRELERRRATGKIRRLHDFVFGVPDRFIPLTTAHLDNGGRRFPHTAFLICDRNNSSHLIKPANC